MKKSILFLCAMALAACASFATAGPISGIFKSENDNTVNFNTARTVAKYGTTIYIQDAAGVNNQVGDFGGTLWAKFIAWNGLSARYVVFAPSGMYVNVKETQRTGCIGNQSYFQFAGMTYPQYYSDNCVWSSAVQQAAEQ